MGHKLFFLLALLLGVALPFGPLMGSGRAAALTHSRKLCGATSPPGTARCHAIVLTNADNITPLATSTPQGYRPADFRTAYGVRATSTSRVAVVAAYDAPTITSDLNSFSKTFDLPIMPTCTSTAQTGCFEKLSQRGNKSYPATNSSWGVEASLDVESIHGQCPGCRIDLIEASSASMSNLAAAVDEAVATGARIISNSYGGSESSGEAAYDPHYHKAGVTMVVSSGDDGYGTNYPAASPYVVAVGGTTLKMSNDRVTSETVWSGAGSGCSSFEAKPSWQHDKKCIRRSVADVAADADPTTGAAIYDSFADNGHSGWFTVGGTSLAAPLVAGIVAASGKSLTSQPAYLYANSGSFIRDIMSGSNGNCLTYFCKAGSGYDGPTGLGVLSHL